MASLPRVILIGGAPLAGKTRLAQALAGRLEIAHDPGRWFVDETRPPETVVMKRVPCGDLPEHARRAAEECWASHLETFDGSPLGELHRLADHAEVHGPVIVRLEEGHFREHERGEVPSVWDTYDIGTVVVPVGGGPPR